MNGKRASFLRAKNMTIIERVVSRRVSRLNSLNIRSIVLSGLESSEVSL
jgi:hypothetical protein